MQKINLKQLSIYSVIILSAMIMFLAGSTLISDSSVMIVFAKVWFVVPVVFALSVFLALRIAETGMALASLTFLIFSLLQLLPGRFPELSGSTSIGRFLQSFGDGSLLPVVSSLVPFSLVFAFFVPDRAGRTSLVFLKAAAALLPFAVFPFYGRIFLFIETHFSYGRYLFPWPAVITAVIIPAAAVFCRSRRAATLSAALSAALLLFLLAAVMNTGDLGAELSSLLAGLLVLHSLYRVYWESSYIDELTGLYNRRAMDERLSRLRKNYVLAMVDVDHFKNFNDKYGHDEGDNVLRLVSKILNQHFGSSAYRYGGEEFCVVFRNTEIKKAAGEMDEARADIEERMFSIRKKNVKRRKSGRSKSSIKTEKVRLTFSAGVAAADKNSRDAESVLKKADKALYAAKEAGRNRVMIVK